MVARHVNHILDLVSHGLFLQMLLIRLDCKFEEEEGGGISLTTDNILHYLGIIEERTLEIISSYERVKKTGNSDHQQTNNSNSFGKDLPLSTTYHGSGLEARPIGGGSTEQALMVNPPRLLDYSSDDESADEGGESSLRPLKREEMNYNKIKERATAFGALPKRRTMTRRGSTFVSSRGRSSMMIS